MGEVMTLRRDELIEQAALEALGLLDENESAAFERAFEAAPETLQEEIRRIQAETVTDVATLSGEEPGAGLRGKVLAAVADAIDDEARELQPIASIGVRAARAGRRVPSEVGAAVQSERHVLRLQSAQRHLLVWRAASIALAASLLTTLFWSGMYRRENGSLQQLVDNGATLQQLETELGTDFAAAVRQSTLTRSFQPVAANTSGQFFLDEGSHTGYVLVFGLRSNASYTLRLRDGSGNVTEVARVTGGAWVTGARLPGVDRESLAGKQFELIDDRGGLVMAGSVT